MQKKSISNIEIAFTFSSQIILVTPLWFSKIILGAQSFTSLKADLLQYINGGFAFSRCINGTFVWRKCSDRALVKIKSEENNFICYSSQFSFVLMYQCLNGFKITSRKCSIKVPAKYKISDYVLTEICHLGSKWLGPKYFSS